MMGKEKGRRRLGNPVYKMADLVMAEDRKISNMENRPFHRAYLVNKLPCPLVHAMFAPNICQVYAKMLEYRIEKGKNQRGRSFCVD